MCELPDLLLHELESPELVSRPVIESQQPLIAIGQVRAFEGIEAEIGEDRSIYLDVPPNQPPADRWRHESGTGLKIRGRRCLPDPRLVTAKAHLVRFRRNAQPASYLVWDRKLNLETVSF